MNIIATATLHALLNGKSHVTDVPRPRAPPEESITGTMPPILSPADMPANTCTLVEALNAFGDRPAILPTMYRHLAHWPPALALIHVLLAPAHHSGSLETLIQSVLAESHQRAGRLAASIDGPTTSQPSAIKDDVDHALTAFTDGPLAKMIAITALIRSAMSIQD